MNTDQVIDLLTLMASYDRRKAGEADVEAWEAAVGSLSFEDCRTAVIAHYQDSEDWIMPVHVRRRVKAMRAERITAGDIGGRGCDRQHRMRQREAGPPTTGAGSQVRGTISRRSARADGRLC